MPRKTESDHLEEARERLIEAALPHVVFDGWSRVTLAHAIDDTGIDEGLAHLAFPRGGIDMALAFHRLMDARLADELHGTEFSQMRIRDRITHAIRRRIELVADNRDAVRRGAALLALPIYAPEGARAIWETADLIWTACGDTSSDYNWYTKRAILSSVYSATALYWLGDESMYHASTWSFLDRRIDNVMKFEKFKTSARENPLCKAAMWGPAQILSFIRAPGQPAPGGGRKTPN